jgi:hypothetical protein
VPHSAARLSTRDALAEKQALRSVSGQVDFPLKLQPKFFQERDGRVITRRGDARDALDRPRFE